ncbi:MAG: hypothetical protein EBZ49_10380 [Proteobacteria bacterium]|nr:hypothetical protein [Pseudomonadota bacterium]
MSYPVRGKFNSDCLREREDPWDSRAFSERNKVHEMRAWYEEFILQEKVCRQALLEKIQAVLNCIKNKKKKHYDFLDATAPLKILDISPGSGSLAIDLAKSGHAVTVCSSSLTIDDLLRNRAKDCGVNVAWGIYDLSTNSLPGAIRHVGYRSRHHLQNRILERYDLILVFGAEINLTTSMERLRDLFSQLSDRCLPGGQLLFCTLKPAWFSKTDFSPQVTPDSAFRQELLPIPEKYKHGSAALGFTQNTYLHRCFENQQKDTFFLDIFMRNWPLNHILTAMQTIGWSKPEAVDLKLPFASSLNFYNSVKSNGFLIESPRFYNSLLIWTQKRDIVDYSFHFPGEDNPALHTLSNFIFRLKPASISVPIYVGINNLGDLVLHWWQIKSGDDHNPSCHWATKDFGPNGDADIHLVPFEWADPLYGEKPAGNKEGWLTRVMDDKDLEKAMKKDILTRIKEIQS